MIEKTYGQIIHRASDDSYVITKNGMPYHVYPYAVEFAEEWDAVFAYAEAHPECVTERRATLRCAHADTGRTRGEHTRRTR